MRATFIVCVALAAAAQAQPPQPSKSPKSESPAVEAIKDEIELLEVQLAGRKAAAKLWTSRAEAAYEAYERLTSNSGISRIELARAKAELDSLQSEAAIRLADLKEHETRITIAKRRLARAQALAQAPPPPEAKDPVRDLVEAFLKNQQQLMDWEKQDRAARLDAEKKQQIETEKALEREKLLQAQREKEQQKLIEEQRKAALENSLKQLNIEIEQAASRAKLMELKLAQAKLELQSISLQADEIKAQQTRLEALRKEMEKQLKGEPK